MLERVPVLACRPPKRGGNSVRGFCCALLAELISMRAGPRVVRALAIARAGQPFRATADDEGRSTLNLLSVRARGTSFEGRPFFKTLPATCYVRGVDVGGAEARHAFRSKQFRKTQRCDLCQQPLRDQGASCRACKYCCHLHCEPKLAVAGLQAFFKSASSKLPSSPFEISLDDWEPRVFILGTAGAGGRCVRHGWNSRKWRKRERGKKPRSTLSSRPESQSMRTAKAVASFPLARTEKVAKGSSLSGRKMNTFGRELISPPCGSSVLSSPFRAHIYVRGW
ncbi:hypothetical protein HPB50_016551 [Hyalomma asiaticum]|uniref:Uncharacterized protein n=1 Tax=Hyalomma asiaticum TaxID=266040 RepID=A0ACB7T1E9_HYAAI|nr:hypothetical protein HPB50_016551 [Hyalomma asiaticum]